MRGSGATLMLLCGTLVELLLNPWTCKTVVFRIHDKKVVVFYDTLHVATMAMGLYGDSCQFFTGKGSPASPAVGEVQGHIQTEAGGSFFSIHAGDLWLRQ